MQPADSDRPLETGDRRAARFEVRWGEPGLCGLSGARPTDQRRAASLRRFESVYVGVVELFVDPEVDDSVLEALTEGLLEAEERSRELLGWAPARPRVHVYASVEALRRSACTNNLAIAYYDGALHISGSLTHERELVRESAIHEYFHHALLSLGVDGPQWLHEGLAMYAAEEQWWRDPRLGLVPWLTNHHLPFKAMVAAFPHTADETFALAAYYQSYRMVDFIVVLNGENVIATLARELARGGLSPEQAFEHATGLFGAELQDKWTEYIQNHR